MRKNAFLNRDNTPLAAGFDFDGLFSAGLFLVLIRFDPDRNPRDILLARLYRRLEQGDERRSLRSCLIFLICCFPLARLKSRSAGRLFLYCRLKMI